MHRDAEVREADWLASQHDGGIVQAFSSHVMSNSKALMKMMYWLAKEEVPHTTKVSSLADLAVQLELNLGKNAHYMSEQSVRELIQCLSSVIEEQILDNIRYSDFFALVTDESTYLAVLKQQVLIARYITE